MKRLSDYKGEEAIDLWADLLEPLSKIFTDEDLRKQAKENKLNSFGMARISLKKYKKEVIEILTRIDDSPINGLNILERTVGIFSEIGESEYAKSFFGFAEQEKQD